jgi:excisionase family DNA binding protein
MDQKKQEKIEDLPELLTLEEASEYLKCHPNTLRQWDKKGILPAIRLGERRVRRYKKEDLHAFLEKDNENI